jgi:hypothetical protein
MAARRFSDAAGKASELLRKVEAAQLERKLREAAAAPRELTAGEVLEACQKEFQAVFSELGSMRNTVRRFERVFEQLFREEAEQRLGLGGSALAGEGACRVSELERLQWRSQKLRDAERA